MLRCIIYGENDLWMKAAIAGIAMYDTVYSIPLHVDRRAVSYSGIQNKYQCRNAFDKFQVEVAPLISEHHTSHQS